MILSITICSPSRLFFSFVCRFARRSVLYCVAASTYLFCTTKASLEIQKQVPHHISFWLLGLVEIVDKKEM